MARFGEIGKQYLDDAGDPLVAGRLYFYESGTSPSPATEKTTYADVNLSIPNANPVELTGAGRQPNIFFEGVAKVILTDADAVQIEVRDPEGEDASGVFAEWSPTVSYATGDRVTGSNGLLYESIENGNQGHDPTTEPQWFRVQFIGTWSSTVTYGINDVVQGSDGLLVRSLVASNLNNDPVTDGGVNWGSPVADPYSTGDVVISANTAEHTAPEWLPCDGLAFDDTVYTALAAVIDPWYAKLADPASIPPSSGGTSGRPVCFSKTDDTFCAVVHGVAPPFVRIYKRSGDTFTKLADPATLPTSTGRNCDFDNADVYLAVAHDGSPYITIYKRSGDTFTKLADPATLPTGSGIGTRFSPSSNYLSVVGLNSPYMAVYSRSGDVFTKLANPATLPTGTGQGTCVDSTDTYFMVAHQTSPFISIYSRSGVTLTKLTNPATLPPGNCYACDVDATGAYWAVGSNVTPYLTIYKRVGSTFTKIADANISEFPTDFARSVKFTDSTTLYVATSTEVHKYERAGDVFTKVATDFVTTDDVGASSIYGLDTSQTGTYAALSGGATPYLALYKKDAYVTPDIDVDTNSHADAYVKTGE